MRVHGVHHATAVTARAAENLAFYTRVLGLHFVKKTVNQDDVRAYHLFYAAEPRETLGQRLSLPPFLEGRRADIEAELKPLEEPYGNAE